MTPTAPGLHFDDETARALEGRLSRLAHRVGEVSRLLSKQEPCDAVQDGALKLREEASAFAVEVLKAHTGTCIAQCVGAGESTAALQSLKAALGRVLQHL